MDNFIVSARKYRPATFESVVGQQHITNTLKNAIRNRQLAHAFLFCGPRGVGKTTCARILAKTINCQDLQPNGEACGVCASCISFQSGSSFNIHELDAASNNSVEDIRSLIEQVRIPPQSGNYKIYIIDEVHMLSAAAFNAFLKTLEEPPHYAIFILATTEKHKILPTILSRCQIFDFNRIRVEDMSAHLATIAEQEGIRYERDALHIIAQKADGGLRDALSMFDQIVSFSDAELSYATVIENLNILDYDYYFRLVTDLLQENTAACLLLFDEILGKGFDGAHFIGGLAEHLRNLLVAKDESTIKLLEVTDSIRSRYLAQSKAASASFLLSAINIANQCEIAYKQSKNQRLQVELSLLKMCHLPSAFRLLTAPDRQASSAPSGEKKKTDDPGAGPGRDLNETDVSRGAAQPKTAVAPADEPAELPAMLSAGAETPRPALIQRSHTTSVKIPSLKDIGLGAAAAQQDDDPYIKGDAREDFRMEDFLKYWNNYAARIKSDGGNMSLFTIFTANAPQMLAPEHIEIVVGNKVQENLFRDEKPNILNYLRTSLRNFALDVSTRVDEIKAAKRPYTNSEKYQHMAGKNPQLAELRKRFNLDVDY